MDLAAIKTDARFLTNTTSDDFTDSEVETSVNRHYDDFVTFIWANQAYWRFQDSNQDKFDYADTDLVDGQTDYLLPTDAREIHKIAVKNAGGEFQLLKRIFEEDLGIENSEYHDDPGMPFGFMLRGRSIELYPPAASEHVTLTKGLRIYVSRSVTLLTSDSDEPGFDREFHRALSYGASIDWCIKSENFTKKRELEAELQKLMERARYFYAHRDETIPQRIRPKTENYS